MLLLPTMVPVWLALPLHCRHRPPPSRRARQRGFSKPGGSTTLFGALLLTFNQTAFDQVGRHFEEKMSLGKFGADARSDAHNVISDMSAEQRSSYTPNQLSTLLSQRQNVRLSPASMYLSRLFQHVQLRDVIAKERSQVNSHAPYSARENYPDDHRPWMPDRKHECKVMACHRCYRLGRQKSWAGLDAVVKGDVLPNIATGYSFSLMGARPVVDAEVVKNIGCRPVPLVRSSIPAEDYQSNPDQPRNHPARGGQVVSTSETETAMSGSSTPASSPTSSSNGTASPPYYSETRGSLWCRERRNSVIDRIGALFAVPRIMPDELEDVYAPDFVLDFDYPEHTLACCTPLPAAEPDEERFLAGYELTAESAAGGQDFLAAEIPALDGIALTEEAVEFGIADLVPALFPEWPGY